MVEPLANNARTLFDVPPASNSVLETVKSPNRFALPVVAIVINSILFPPPCALAAIKPRVLLDAPDGPLVATVMSPKSVPFPVVAIVTNSILICVSGDAGVFLPAAKNARVGDANPAWSNLPVIKSPKSVAFPVVAMVTKSILLCGPGVPPTVRIPRVDDDAPDPRKH